MLTRRQFSSVLPLAFPLARASAAVSPPAPYGALPSDRQLHWQEMEFYGFLHFTVNTFTDKEWGYGDEDPSIFNPTAFDADRIVEALAAAGMNGVILTCKHHDGFCLWPTRTTEHSIRNSKWRGGKGDIVRDLSAAAAKRGLKFGVYLSPWDRNNAQYGRPEYVETYRRQLRELLTGYGPIFEVWHDGANGGDGYYGGAREKRQIDRKTYYDWPKTWDMVRSLAPGAVIFSDVGPDIRWVGNERGIANETCWETFDPEGRDGGPAAPGDIREKQSPTGTRNGKHWLPAECDVSIRPGWFWHERENAKVKSPDTLLDLYFKSVGRGASFLLNVPPDRRGLIHETDADSLRQFGAMTKRIFGTNLAARAKVTASNVRGKAAAYAPERLLDGDRYTYWSTDDGVTEAEVALTFGRPETFDIVRIRENIRLGQRIEAVALDSWQDGAWREFAQATSIGACRLIRTAEPVTSPRLRLRVTKSPVAPALSELAVFRG
jgi:alpha-L-fucosidase